MLASAWASLKCIAEADRSGELGIRVEGNVKRLAAGKAGGQAHELNASAKSPSTDRTIFHI